MATLEYHQQAVDHLSPVNHEWCTYYLNSGLEIFSKRLFQIPTTSLDDNDKESMKSRVSFWSNYSEIIGPIRFVAPESWKIRNTLGVDFSNLEYFTSNDDEYDGQNAVCVFELQSIIAAVTLTGRASEVRLFSNNSRNRNRLLNSNELTLTAIRKAACLQLHDHVTLWQFFFEQILRKQFDIYPNKGIVHFKGMRKEYGRYDRVNGLARPSNELIAQRNGYLNNWLAAFRKRERMLNASDEGSAFIRLQYAKLAKIRGDTERFRRLIREASTMGNFEAKCELALDILRYNTTKNDEKIEAENMLRDAASEGYEPAKKLCEQFSLTYQKKALNYQRPDKASTSESVVPKLTKTVDQSASLERIKNKLSKNDTRPYVSLKIDELEVLAEDKELSYMDKLGIANELEQRKPTQRVKNLIEFLDVS